LWDITPCNLLKVNPGVASQKTELFITTAVSASNHTLDTFVYCTAAAAAAATTNNNNNNNNNNVKLPL
jgi:hypothetical protein